MFAKIPLGGERNPYQLIDYNVPFGFVTPSFETVYCLICGHLKVAVARYRMICHEHANDT